MTHDERLDLMPPLSPPQAADYLTMRGLRTTARTVQRAILAGELQATRTPGGQARIRRSVIDRYLREHKTH